MSEPIAASVTPPARPSSPAAGAAGIGHFLKRHLRDYGMLLSLVAIMALFEFLTDGTLLEPLNLTNLVLQNSYIVIMALGMLLVIVAGHIDLSVGSVCGFIGALAAVLMVQYEWAALPAALVCLLAGAVIGGAQGWFVAYLGIPSFIVTLAGMLVFKGLALALLQGQSLGPFPDSFQALSAGFLPELFGQEDPRPTTLGLGLLLTAVAVVVAWRHRSAAPMTGQRRTSTPPAASVRVRCIGRLRTRPCRRGRSSSGSAVRPDPSRAAWRERPAPSRRPW